MIAFKFLIPADDWRKLPKELFPNSTGDMEVAGCVAVVVADSEEKARERLRIYARENGRDITWVQVADLVRIPLDGEAVLCFVQL